MVDPDRRPSAQEIDELTELVRRDPSSPAFIDLGEAYLSLGRPRDALEVGSIGLSASPDSVEGRVMLARAHILLHQWKEAQAELLRVVKVDRSNKPGFALLGEVLLRRSDYERAVPVLQHAQNLDPTSPHVLTLLRRARAGQSLDPPPPVPTPMQPRGARPAPPKAPPRSSARYDDVAEIVESRGMRDDAPRLLDDPGRRPRERPAPPAPAPLPPHNESPSRRSAARPNQAPVDPGGAPVRPRVVASTKPVNAAQASLRQSAAVGENYLNDLLTGGLLDVGGVRAPDIDYDLRPDRRWGRSTTRTFVFLFVILFLGIGGGGFYWYYSEKQKEEKIARLQKEAQSLIVHGTFDGFETALDKLKSAINTDNENTLTFAIVSEVAGLEALLYGTDTDRVDPAIKAAQLDISKPEHRGFRELVIGRAAVELSRLPKLDAPAVVLDKVAKSIDDWIAGNPQDRWARWLKARALLAAGKRRDAQASLVEASTGRGDGDPGLVVAMIDRADLLVDDGKFEEAMKVYDEVLGIAKEHPLAILGKSLARAEYGVDSSAAIDDLSVKLEKVMGIRMTAYRQLALAFARYSTEDYPGFKEALAGATGISEPRFLSRVALGNLLKGDVIEAARARGLVHWFGKDKAEEDSLYYLVEVGLLVAGGLPDKALEVGSKIAGVRAGIFRAQAQLDLGKGKDAQIETDELFKVAPENIEVQILQKWAAVLVANSKQDRDDAVAALASVGRKAKTRYGRHALGMAYLAIGDKVEGKSELEEALKGVADDAPHPVIYRTHAELAKLAIDAGELDTAFTHLDAALKANPGYHPARALQAKMKIMKGDYPGAAEDLTLIKKDEAQGSVTPAVQLMMQEAILLGASKLSDTQRREEIDTLVKLKGKVPDAEIGRILFRIDEDLPKALGFPEPDDDDDDDDKKRRRGR
jgi:tetratricopeptide (TPR) repeat protein